MEGEEKYSLDYLLELTKTDKDSFWKILYESVKKAIEKQEETAVIFQVVSKDPDGSEITTITLSENQFTPLLQNYLYYSEINENYEKCIEIKAVIEEYKEMKRYRGWS